MALRKIWDGPLVANVLLQAQFRPQRPIYTLLFLSALWCHHLSLLGITVSFLSSLQAHHDPGMWHACHHNGTLAGSNPVDQGNLACSNS